MSKLKIGFIGQGFIGKNYADDFEDRGFNIVRFAKEEPYHQNKEKIKDCDIVFIAVPTSTTPKGYDSSIIEDVIPLTGRGKIVVLKSTILPGLTRIIQKKFADRIIIHSPEFLSEATARQDASFPFQNIVGIPNNSAKHKKSAELVLSVLPKAPYNSIVTSEEAEIIKYTHNCSGYTQILFFNIMYDLAIKLGADWSQIEKALHADPYIPNRYSSPVHKSGRGAGGHCFIKDFSALKRTYKKMLRDGIGTKMLEAMECKNIDLLKKSKKDLDLLKGVYGKKV